MRRRVRVFKKSGEPSKRLEKKRKKRETKFYFFVIKEKSLLL